MSSPIETYIDKLAVLDAAERDAQDAVNKIHEAATAAFVDLLCVLLEEPV